MLVPVLRFNPIARRGRRPRERHVAIMAPLGIGKMRRRAPEAAPIRSRTVLSRSQASLGAILHGQPLSGIWKPRQGSDFFIGGRFGLPSCRGGPRQPQPQLRRTRTCLERIRRLIAMPSEMRCEWSTRRHGQHTPPADCGHDIPFVSDGSACISFRSNPYDSSRCAS